MLVRPWSRREYFAAIKRFHLDRTFDCPELQSMKDTDAPKAEREVQSDGASSFSWPVAKLSEVW
jgi:hypothetical protein